MGTAHFFLVELTDDSKSRISGDAWKAVCLSILLIFVFVFVFSHLLSQNRLKNILTYLSSPPFFKQAIKRPQRQCLQQYSLTHCDSSKHGIWHEETSSSTRGKLFHLRGFLPWATSVLQQVCLVNLLSVHLCQTRSLCYCHKESNTSLLLMHFINPIFDMQMNRLM